MASKFFLDVILTFSPLWTSQFLCPASLWKGGPEKEVKFGGQVYIEKIRKINSYKVRGRRERGSGAVDLL